MPESLYEVAELVLAIRFIPALKHLFNTRHYIIQNMCQLLQCLHMELHIVSVSATQKFKFHIDFFIAFIVLKSEPLINSIVCNHHGIKLVCLCPSNAVILCIFLHCVWIDDRDKISFFMKERQDGQMINSGGFHNNLYLSI